MTRLEVKHDLFLFAVGLEAAERERERERMSPTLETTFKPVVTYQERTFVELLLSRHKRCVTTSKCRTALVGGISKLTCY